RFSPVGDRLPRQGELSSFRLRVDPLDDSTVEVRHPDARGLEGVSAARVREYRVGGVLYRQEMDLMRTFEILLPACGEKVPEGRMRGHANSTLTRRCAPPSPAHAGQGPRDCAR